MDGTLQGEMTDQELLLLLDIKSRRDDGTLSWRREIFKAATLHPPSEKQISYLGALETEGFLEGAKAQRLAAYARTLREIRCSDEQSVADHPRISQPVQLRHRPQSAAKGSILGQCQAV